LEIGIWNIIQFLLKFKPLPPKSAAGNKNSAKNNKSPQLDVEGIMEEADDQEEGKYEVEKLLDRRVLKNRQVEYLVSRGIFFANFDDQITIFYEEYIQSKFDNLCKFSR
jgi:hypothetical protein